MKTNRTNPRKNEMVPVTRARFVEFIRDYPKPLASREAFGAQAPRLVEWRDGERVCASAVIDVTLDGREYAHDHKIRDDLLG